MRGEKTLCSKVCKFGQTIAKKSKGSSMNFLCFSHFIKLKAVIKLLVNIFSLFK